MAENENDPLFDAIGRLGKGSGTSVAEPEEEDPLFSAISKLNKPAATTKTPAAPKEDFSEVKTPFATQPTPGGPLSEQSNKLGMPMLPPLVGEPKGPINAFRRNQKYSNGTNEDSDFQTNLGKDEPKFLQWVKDNKIPFDPNGRAQDYDMRGFYKAFQAGDPEAKRAASNGHFPDKWKTPFHQTFSNESMYATKDAPHWDGDKLIDKNGTILADERPQSGPHMVRGMFGNAIPPAPVQEQIDRQDTQEFDAKQKQQDEALKDQNTDPLTRFVLKTTQNVQQAFTGSPETTKGAAPMPEGMLSPADAFKTFWQHPGTMRPALEEFVNDKIGKAALKSTSELLTPDNLMLMGSMETIPPGFTASAAGKVLLGGGFTAQMASGLIKQYPDFRDAIVHDDWEKAATIGAGALPTLLFTAEGLRNVFEGLAQGVGITKGYMNAWREFDRQNAARASQETPKLTEGGNAAPPEAPEAAGGPEPSPETEEAPAPPVARKGRKAAASKIPDAETSEIVPSKEEAKPEGLPTEPPTREVMRQPGETSRATPTSERAEPAALPEALKSDLEEQAGHPLSDEEAIALDRANLERGMASAEPGDTNAIREAKREELEQKGRSIEPIVETPAKGVELGEKISPSALDSGAWSLYGEEHFTDLSKEKQDKVVASMSKRTTGESIAASQKQAALPEGPPQAEGIAHYYNEDEGTESTVTRTPKGFAVNMKDTESGNDLGVVRIFKDQTAALNHAQGLVNRFENIPAEGPPQSEIRLNETTPSESGTLPTEAPKPSLLEHAPPGGFTEADKVPERIGGPANEKWDKLSPVERMPYLRDVLGGAAINSTAKDSPWHRLSPKTRHAIAEKFAQEPESGTLPKEEAPTDGEPSESGIGNELEPVGEAGDRSLEDVSPEDVQGTSREGTPARTGGEGSGADTGRPVESDNAGLRSTSRVGNGEGEVSVPSGREGRSGITTGPADYRITAADEIGSGGLRTKFKQNLAAIRTLKLIESEGRLATLAEQAELVKYVGWGGLKQVFKIESQDQPEYQDVKSLLSDEEYRAARASVLNAHYTSEPVIRAIWSAMDRFGFKGGRLLEPSAGIGHFLGLQPGSSAAHTTRTAIELDGLTGRILKQLYQKADVRIQGFEKLQNPSDFDVVVGNVPFGEYKVHDPEYNKFNLSIHNYFAVKALDKMRPGGIAALITGKYTMDSADSKARRLIAERAALVGAIRLPNTAFKGNANTEVTTDILFLRKRGPGEVASGEGFEKLDEITSPKGSTIKVNEYFAKHPDMMLGTMELEGTMYRGGEPTLVAYPDEDIEDLLAEAVRKLPDNVLKPRTVPESVTHDATIDSIPDYGTTKPLGLAIRSGKVMRRIGDRLEHVADYPKASVQRLKGLLSVRDAARELLQAEGKDRPTKELDHFRAQLNAIYDKFVQKNGLLHDRQNQKAMHGDPDLPLVLSLEKYDARSGTAKKSDVFVKTTVAPRAPIESVDNAKDAMLVSLSEHGKLDFEHMSKLTGKAPEELQNDLQSQGLVFKSPDGHWDPADVYLSGNVRQKLGDAELAGKEFEANVKALRAVLPEDLPPSDIKLKLGSPWIPKRVIEEFVAHILGGPQWLRNVMVQHIESQGLWTLRVPNASSSGNATTKWGTPRAIATWLIEKALNQQIPVIYDKGAKEEPAVVNQKETLAAQAKLEELNAELPRWIFQDSKHGDDLAAMYNEKFNSEVPWQPDGSHLTLPGKSVDVEPRPHQKDTIWRSISGSGNVLADHVVGGGKTYIGVGTAMEWRRIGRARKPLIVVPNNLTEQWAKDFLKMYPLANVLHATPKDFEGPHRKEFASRIATGDWDSVILGHRSYEFLSVSDEQYQDFMQEQMDALDAVMHELKQQEGKRGPTVRQLEAAKKKLEAKLAERLDRERKDNTINFDDLGIDALIVDEAHKFKNLYFPTRMGRIPGVPQSDSNRATDMYLKTRIISRMNNGKNILFMTGTPVSNTMAEMYVMGKYLDEQNMKSLGIDHFDSWAAQFGRVVSDIEIAPEDPSRFRTNTRFAKFANMGDLNRLYLRFADVKTAEDLNLPTPKLLNGKQETIVVPTTEALTQYVKELGERADAVRKRQVDPHDDNMLKITSDAKKAAIDMRMVDPSAEDHPDSKINRVVQEVVKRYHDKESTKGTQIVMLDLGVPSVEGKKSGAFNAYEDMKRKMVNRGIPSNEIQFVQDFDTAAKKQGLFNDFNDGKVRVIFGSTETMGVGVNAQKRLYALHHVDVPWRPSDIEQREGRILRQGNDNEFVEIPRYVTQGSFDAYNWDIIKRKSRFIAQKGKDLKTREIEDVDARTLSAEEAMALASGNPLIPMKIRTELELNKLRQLQQAYLDAQFNNKVHIAKLPEEIEATKKAATDYDADAKMRDEKLTEKFQINVKGKSFDDRKLAGAAINEAAIKNLGNDPVRVGSYAGFDIFVRGNFDGYLQGKRSYFFDTNRENPLGTLQSIEATIRRIEGKSTERKERVKTLSDELTQRQAEVGKPFPQAAKIEELQKTLDEVNQKLAVDKAHSGDTGGGTPPPPDNPMAMSMLGLQGIYNQLARAMRAVRRPSGAPAPISKADVTKGVIRERTGTRERANVIQTTKMRSERKRVQKWSAPESLDFIDRMENGLPQRTDQDDKLAEMLRQGLDEARDKVQGLGTGKLDSFIENYFPHIWDRPSQAATVIQKIMGKRPLEGPASFLKKRTIPTTMEGIDAGLRPVTYNPVDLALLKIREMNRYVMAHEIVADLKERGLAKFVKFAKPAPDGWKPLNDKVFRALQYSEIEKGFINRGSYYAPAEAADVVNNFLSPGLRGDWRYDIIRNVGNLLNQAQLGMSAFHLMFTAMDAMTSDIALGIEKGMRGDMKGALLVGRALSLVGSPISTYLKGSKVLKEYMSPGKYQEMSALADAVSRAGGRAMMDKFYKSDNVEAFWKAWKEGRWAAVGLRSFPAALEMAAKPIMEHIVPRMKLGVFANLANDVLEKMPESATHDDINHALDKAWDSVDNRMGQMVYDNLFWNKTVKDLGMIGTRSLGWNIGTVRELGGGVKDFGEQAKRAATGKTPEFTHRMAYVIALPIAAAWAGAVFMYLATGRRPEEARDYYYPQNGKTDEDGNAERLQLPTYMKDVVGFSHAPAQTTLNKFHPIFHAIAEMLANKDFYGNKIRNEDDPLVVQVAEIMKYVAQAFVPFAARNAAQAGKEQGEEKGIGRFLPTTPEKAEGFLGITKAPRYMVRTPAENKISDYMAEQAMQGGRTTQNAERYDERRRLAGGLRSGKVSEADVQKSIDAKKITAQQGKQLIENKSASPLARVGQLSLEQVLNVYDVANKQEREEILPHLRTKVTNLSSLDNDSRKEVEARVTKIFEQTGNESFIPSHVDDELARLNYNGLRSVDAMNKTIKYQGLEIHLGPKEQAEYQEMRGKLVREQLGKMIEDPEYKKLSDEDKLFEIRGMVKDADAYNQEQMIDKLVGRRLGNKQPEGLPMEAPTR